MLSFKDTFRHFWSFVISYKKRLLIFFFLLVFLGILESVQPIFYRQFVDSLTYGRWKLIGGVLILYGLVRFGSVIVDIITFYVGDLILIPASRDARLAVFKKLQELDFAYHLNKSSGSLISRIKRGDSAFFILFHNLSIVIRIVINLIIILVSFWFLGWWISGVTLLFIFLNLVLIYFLIKYNVSTRSLFNKWEDEVSAIIVDNLINYETVKLFAQEDYEYNRLRQTFKKWYKALWRYANSFRLIDIGLGTVGNTLMFGLSLWGVKAVFNKQLTTGEFIMILGFISSFYWRFFDLVYKLRDIAKSYSDIEKYFGVLEEKTIVKDPPRPRVLKRVRGEISFKHVWFVYREENYSALEDFNLEIRQGQSVALVGRSGAGKTTVVKLLLRFFDIDKGQITIDGVDIREFSKKYLRSLFGVVPQEAILFNNTLRFNIAYGRPEATEEEIIAAAKMAYIWDFIKQLPLGLDTLVGERGVKLSGGQRQRIAIARVILKNPKIIIFDEATSQLDSESEELIQKAFWNISHNKTTIVIAHRLSTIVKADKIVVVDKGRVIEEGSHRELIKRKNSLYKYLWLKQSGLIN